MHTMNTNPSTLLPLRGTCLALALALSGCYGDGGPSDPPDEKNARAAVSNQSADLGARVRITDQAIALESGGNGKTTAKALDLQLVLVAEVDPPVVDGEPVQANSVSLDDDGRGVVGYNTRGEVFRGAIDLFVGLDGGAPELSSSAGFNDTDVNAVLLHDDEIYTAQATGAEGFVTSAAVEYLKVNKDAITLKDNKRVDIASFAGTGLGIADGHVMATSGDGGGVYRLHRKSLNLEAEASLDDARWVAASGDGQIAVVQGTPGRMTLLDDADLVVSTTHSFDGADVPESKSTIEVVGGKAFIAAGPAGVQVLSTATGQVLATIPPPDAASLALDPSVVVTNSVSVDGALIFISNGEAGVYVVQASGDLDGVDSETVPTLSSPARLRFDDLQSANHVAYRNGFLFVAAGTGGLKIVSVIVND